MSVKGSPAASRGQGRPRPPSTRKERGRVPHKGAHDLCRLSSGGHRALGAALGTTLVNPHAPPPHPASSLRRASGAWPTQLTSQASEGTMRVCEQGHYPHNPAPHSRRL